MSKRAKPFPANNASRKKLESEGWVCDVVERWAGPFKKDFLGFADIIALSPARGILAVQATGGPDRSNMVSRIAKIKAEPRHAVWLACGGRIKVMHWQGKGNQRECHEFEILREG